MAGSIDEAYQMLCQLQRKSEESAQRKNELTTMLESLEVELKQTTENIANVRAKLPVLDKKYDEVSWNTEQRKWEHDKLKKDLDHLTQWVENQTAQMNHYIDQVSELYDHSNVSWKFSTENTHPHATFAQRLDSGFATVQKPVDLSSISVIYKPALKGCTQTTSLEEGAWRSIIEQCAKQREIEVSKMHSKIRFPGVSKSPASIISPHPKHTAAEAFSHVAAESPGHVMLQTNADEQICRPKSTTVFRMKRNR